MHVIHMLICFIYLKMFESGILVSGMSTVCEDTDGCAKQYRRALDIYLMTMLSYSYGIRMDSAINTPGHGKNVVDGINTNDKHYLKGKMDLIGKLAINDTSNIGMIPSASKCVSIKCSDQSIKIINDKDRLNVLKVSQKVKNIQSLLKYQSRI